MTLDEFMKGAHAELDAFAESTRRAQESGAPEFQGPYLDRVGYDWWYEVAAYHKWVEMEELIRQLENGGKKG